MFLVAVTETTKLALKQQQQNWIKRKLKNFENYNSAPKKLYLFVKTVTYKKYFRVFHLLSPPLAS